MNRLKQLSLKMNCVSGNKNTDLVLIRHAQSEFNLAEANFAKEKGIPNNFKQMFKYPDFNEKVVYNIKYMDAPITKLGYEQVTIFTI